MVPDRFLEPIRGMVMPSFIYSAKTGTTLHHVTCNVLTRVQSYGVFQHSPQFDAAPKLTCSTVCHCASSAAVLAHLVTVQLAS